MSGDIRFRLYLDNAPATREQLDQVEEITVEQAMDATWHASLSIPIGTSDGGEWEGVDKAFLAAMKRVRVELDPGDGKFVPLIDGPISRTGRQMSSEPGQSTHATTVVDDSIYLNRRDSFTHFENKSAHEIVTEIYTAVTQIKTRDVSEDTPDPQDSVPPGEFQRGTEMQLLRRLATRHGVVAYVLPGSKPGESIGVFRALPTEPDGLPPLVLLGSERNVASFNAHFDGQSPAGVETRTLSITDKSVTHASASFRDVELLGKKPAVDSDSETLRILPPGMDGIADAKSVVQSVARKLSFAFEASGSVLGDRYGAVLSPYRVVTVKGVDGTQSGNYIIKSVTHRLGRSSYEQSFTLTRNARSESKGSGLSIPAGIF